MILLKVTLWEDGPNQFLLFAVEKEVTTWAEVGVWVMCLLLGYWFKKQKNTMTFLFNRTSVKTSAEIYNEWDSNSWRDEFRARSTWSRSLTALSSLRRAIWPLDDGATVSCGWKVFWGKGAILCYSATCWNPTCQAAQEYILQELASDS